MHKSLFTPAPFFLLRTPAWPIEEYKRILSQENWQKTLLDLYESNEWLREAIFAASPTLYNSLQKKSLKGLQQALRSLLKYVLRMTTRATPFGLFSFVAIGRFGKEMRNSVELRQVCKRARPDMEWIYLFVQKLYADEKTIFSRSVRANPLAWMHDERVFLNYLRIEQHDGKYESNTASVHANNLVTAILSLSKEPIEIGALLVKLQEFIPTLDPEKALLVIQQLLSNQFLLPGVLPTLLNGSPFEELLSKLPSYEDLKAIIQKMDVYNQLSPAKEKSNLANCKKRCNPLRK